MALSWSMLIESTTVFPLEFILEQSEEANESVEVQSENDDAVILFKGTKCS